MSAQTVCGTCAFRCPSGDRRLLARRRAAEDRVKRRPERVDVGAVVRPGLGRDDLGREEPAREHVGRIEARDARRARFAKSKSIRYARPSPETRMFEGLMSPWTSAALVDELQRPRDLEPRLEQAEQPGFLERRRESATSSARPPRHEHHREVLAALVLAVAVDGNDARVRDRREQARALLEVVRPSLVGRQRAREDLERHGAIERRLARAVDDAARADREELLDHVVVDDGPGRENRRGRRVHSCPEILPSAPADLSERRERSRREHSRSRSSTDFGAAAVRTSGAPAVTRTSSSIRIPMPRNSGGASVVVGAGRRAPARR